MPLDEHRQSIGRRGSSYGRVARVPTWEMSSSLDLAAVSIVSG